MKRLLLVFVACSLVSLAGLAAPDRAIASWCETRIICPPPFQPWKLGCYSNFGSCYTTDTSVQCGSTVYTCADCQSGLINCNRLQDP